MESELVALIIDSSSASAEHLATALKPEVALVECDFTNSLHKAIQSHIDTIYSLCFIGAEFSKEDVASFFEDIKKLEREIRCVFVQVHETLKDDFDKAASLELGFHAVISRSGTHADKRSISTVLKEHFFEQELAKKIYDVDASIVLLLNEIDRVAKDRKRGRPSQFNTLAMDFIEMQTEFDAEILTCYYDALLRRTENAEPTKCSTIKVPQTILEKKLPFLSESTYIGVSSRVWDKLIKKHGIPCGAEDQNDSQANEADDKE